MESMGKKRPRPRRSFTAQFKAEIVELCPRGDRTIGQVSDDFDLTETAVREWIKPAELDTGTRSDGLTSDEKAELTQLRRENRRLREDVDILKRATAARPQTHRPADAWRRCARQEPAPVADDHHRRPGGSRSCRPDRPGLHHRPRPRRRPLVRRHHLHQHVAGLVVSGHRHRSGVPPRRGLGRRRPSQDRPGRCRAGRRDRATPPDLWVDLPFRPRLSSTPALNTPASPPRTASACPRAGAGNAGTTR